MNEQTLVAALDALGWRLVNFAKEKASGSPSSFKAAHQLTGASQAALSPEELVRRCAVWNESQGPAGPRSSTVRVRHG